MASIQLRSKTVSFKQQSQAWFCTAALPSDITVEVGEISFHLHKFPLLSKCGLLEKLIGEKSDQEEEKCIIKLPDLPGGAKAFELVAKFCYGVKLELTASNVVYVCCAAEHLQMTEEIAEGNLIALTESFLNRVVLRSWKDSVKVLQTCDDMLSHAEDLHIVKRCIDFLATKACTDPNLFGWPLREHGPLQSPGGSVLWNGISTGARLRNSNADWWYEDVSSLSLPMYKRLISVMKSRGIREEIIVGSLTFYAKRHLPGLNRHQGISEASIPLDSKAAPTKEEQKHILEELDRLLPLQKSVTSTKFLFGLLRIAMILQASPSCQSNLERRIGMQLDEATLEDLLIPNFHDSMETLYNVDCIHRILGHFVAMDQMAGRASPDLADDEQLLGSPSLTPITVVAKLIDEYLVEVAPDVNLKLPKFQSLAAAIPEYARSLHDGVYRAIDVYLKAHPWLTDSERKELCQLMDCHKLSLEAGTHAAQNERLPLRVAVEVIFFEQLQLRRSIAGSLVVSGSLDHSRSLRNDLPLPGEGGGWASAMMENKALKAGMDDMMMRLSELEKECSSMREEIDKLALGKKSRSNIAAKLVSNIISHRWSAQGGSASNEKKCIREG